MLGKYVSAEYHAKLLSEARARSHRWLCLEPDAVANNYNRHPFLFSHLLSEHPAFTFDALRALCLRLPASQVKVRQGDVPAGAHFNTSLPRYAMALPLEEAFDSIEERQAYIAVYNPEQDAEYRTILEGLLGEIGMAIEPYDRHITWYSTYLFISAHDSVTPYHNDREMNFLLQIRGGKSVRLWDPNDDAVMTSADRDHLFSYAPDSHPRYRPELDALAKYFELRPGMGVHHPFIAPHLVRTGSETSITLALTFRSARSDAWTDAHYFNLHMRKLGLPATCVGRVEWVDKAKAYALRCLRRTKAIFA